jgi:hypothetical protein
MSPRTDITYEDIKKALSQSDLNKYNELCRSFVRLVEGKNNQILWHELEQPCELSSVLENIHQLKKSYGLVIEGKPFFSVWNFDPKTKNRLVKAWG